MATTMISGWLRWGGACVLAAAMATASPLATASPVVLAARTGPIPSAVSRPVPDVALEVKVAPGIPDAAGLRSWVDEEGRRVLDELPQPPKRQGVLRIEIGGALYEYQVTITALRGGVVVGEPSTWGCECSNEELLEKLRGGVVAGVGGLAVEEEPVVVAPKPEPKPTKAAMVDEPPHRRLGPAGAAGVTLMVLGATGVGTGVALMVVGDRDEPVPIGQVGVRKLFVPGQVVVAAGGGVLVTGMVLYFLRKRIDRSGRKAASMVTPAFDGRGEVRFSVVGRF